MSIEVFGELRLDVVEMRDNEFDLFVRCQRQVKPGHEQSPPDVSLWHLVRLLAPKVDFVVLVLVSERGSGPSKQYSERLLHVLGL